MIIEQEETFRPLTVTLETKAEYVAFCQIVDEAERIGRDDRKFMGDDADTLAITLSDYFSNNV